MCTQFFIYAAPLVNGALLYFMYNNVYGGLIGLISFCFIGMMCIGVVKLTRDLEEANGKLQLLQMQPQLVPVVEEIIADDIELLGSPFASYEDLKIHEFILVNDVKYQYDGLYDLRKQSIFKLKSDELCLDEKLLYKKVVNEENSTI